MTRTDFLNVAPHIRGWVEIPDQPSRWPHGKRHYHWQVWNMATRQLIKESDAFGFEEAIKLCSSTVASARSAWFWSWRQRNLRETA